MTFAEALRAAMDERGVTIVALSRATGLDPDLISRAMRGLRRPTLTTVTLLADALDAGQLTIMAEAERRKRCDVCRRRYVDMGKSNRGRYCTERCQQTAHARRFRKRRHDITAARLREHQEAVAAFCLSCEPVRRSCSNADCELRSLSPLPLIQLTRRVA